MNSPYDHVIAIMTLQKVLLEIYHCYICAIDGLGFHSVSLERITLHGW